MNYIRHLNGFFDLLAEDNRMSAYHVSLYMALFKQWNLNRFRNPFPVLREELMQMARIGSKTTYARCMKELHGWGYISYSPSGNWHTGRHVSCTCFDMDKSPKNGTGKGTGRRTRSGTQNRTGSGTLLLNISNNPKQDKQETPKKFQNGERKNRNGAGPYHVRNDKDYSEPL